MWIDFDIDSISKWYTGCKALVLLTDFPFLHLLQWQTENSRPFEVMLVLISFLIAWAEAWFIDFRVLPQEARARSILEGKEIQANSSYTLEEFGR